MNDERKERKEWESHDSRHDEAHSHSFIHGHLLRFAQWQGKEWGNEPTVSPFDKSSAFVGWPTRRC